MSLIIKELVITYLQNPNTSKELEIKLKIQTSVLVGPDGSVYELWEFLKVDLVLGPKTAIHPHDLFCQNANSRKISMLGS
jgi:hypothetical protein